MNHDDEAGRVAVGMRADLAVLDRNPFEGEPTAIHTTGTVATVANGEVVFSR